MNIFKDAKNKAQGYMTKQFDTRCQKQIKNLNPTILASTCVGGVIYHHLGMKFLSPTVNLWIRQPDFCEFISKLNYYIQQPLEFYNEPSRDCPVAYLGQKVRIDFVHYKSADDAEECWERRCRRINQNNLYLITSDGNGLTEDDWGKLDTVPCKRKIIFTSKPRPELQDSFYLKCMKPYDSAARHMLVMNKITGRRKLEDEFDFVAWLNDETNFRR